MKLDLEKFEPLLGEWFLRLKPVFEKPEMYNLYQEMKKLSLSGVKLTPKSSDLWRFLKECSPNNLKLVIIGMD